MLMDVSAPARLTARQAAQRLGVSRALIETWAKERKCPFIPDEPFQVFRNPHSRKGVRYDAEQITRIQQRRLTIQQTKGKQSGYLTYAELRKRFNWKQKTLQGLLYTWQEDGCSYLDGVRLDAHKEMRPVDKDNRLRKIWVYSLAQLEQINEIQREEQYGTYRNERGVWLSAKTAHEVYPSIWDSKLGYWQEQACSYLGRPIHYLPVRRPGGRGPHRCRTMYLEADLQAISDAQHAGQPEPAYQDDEGTWIFAAGVAARTAWPASGLRYYRLKEWACFVGRAEKRLRAKQVPASCHAGVFGPGCEVVWAYHR